MLVGMNQVQWYVDADLILDIETAETTTRPWCNAEAEVALCLQN